MDGNFVIRKISIEIFFVEILVFGRFSFINRQRYLFSSKDLNLFGQKNISSMSFEAGLPTQQYFQYSVPIFLEILKVVLKVTEVFLQ
jgi:hypothetical protein